MTLAFVFLTTVVGQAELHPEAAIAAWRVRYKTFSSVEFVAEGQIVTTPSFIVGLGVPTQDLPDHPMPFKLHAKFDFKNQKAWVQRDKYQWNVPLKAFRRKIVETFTVDGKSRVVTRDPDSGVESERLYDEADHAWSIHRDDTLPIWLNSGILAVDKPVFTFSDESPLRGAWTIVPDDLVKTSGVVRISGTLGLAGSTCVVLLDSQQQYVVRSIERFHRGSLSKDMKVSYSTIEGAYVPSQWETSCFESERLILHQTLTVTQFCKDCVFPEETFALTAP